MDGADGVYPSSEDTFLLIEALELDKSRILDATNNGGLCLELGCGSGEVSEALARITPASFCISTDVNYLATTKTKHMLQDNGLINVDTTLCDLFTAFRPTARFDVIVFNPPYVPTDQGEMEHALTKRDIYASWAGGKDGRQVIDNFLATVNPFLSERGVVYLVILETNKLNEITSVAEVQGLNVCQVLKRRAGIETLYILRLGKRRDDG